MISGKEIKAIIDAIVKGYQPCKVILFGSYAQGTANQDSDLDILIIKDDNLPKVQKNRFVRSLLKDFMVPVDVFVKTSKDFEEHKDITGTIAYSAHKYGKTIYG